MRRFLYHLSGVSGANSRMLSARGILGRFTNGAGELIEHGCTSSIDGPANDGRVGCLIAAGGRPAQYDARAQRWLPLSASPDVYVGLEDVNLPPGPADLERELGVAGYELRLADGRAWRIPLIKKWDHQLLEHVPALPQAIIGENVAGKYRYISKVRPEFTELDAIGETVFLAFRDSATTTIDDLFGLCAKLLEVNYRLGPEEIVLLGLLTPDVALEVLRLSIDTPGMRRCAGKLSAIGLMRRSTAAPREEKDTR